MPEKKTLNEDLFYKGSSANLPRLHTCENKVPFWDFKEFAVTQDSAFLSDVAVNHLKKVRGEIWPKFSEKNNKNYQDEDKKSTIN